MNTKGNTNEVNAYKLIREVDKQYKEVFYTQQYFGQRGIRKAFWGRRVKHKTYQEACDYIKRSALALSDDDFVDGVYKPYESQITSSGTKGQ